MASRLAFGATSCWELASTVQIEGDGTAAWVHDFLPAWDGVRRRAAGDYGCPYCGVIGERVNIRGVCGGCGHPK